MKKRAKIAVVLGLLAGAAFWVQHGSWLSARLRGPLQDALSGALGREVRIEGVGGGLRGWLWLRGVSVRPLPGAPSGISATARALGLKLDFSDLLRGRVDLRSLEAVQVVSPNVFLYGPSPFPPPTRAPGPAPLSFPASTSAARPVSGPAAVLALLRGLPIPPVPLEVDGGALWRSGPAGVHAWVQGLYAGAEPLPGGAWRLRVTGRPWGSGEASLSASCGPDFSSPTAQAEVRDVEWPSWGRLGAWNIPAGRLSGTLTARPQDNAWPGGWDLKADGSIEDGEWETGPGRPGVSGLRVRWSLRGPRLDFSGQGACSAGGISGLGRLGLDARVLALTVTAQGNDLGALAQALGAPKDIGLSGPADLSFTAFGPWAAPDLGLRLDSRRALWNGHPLAGLDLTAAGRSDAWNALGGMTWDGGHGSVSLLISGGGVERAALQVVALPADWLDSFTGKELRGRLDGAGVYARKDGAWKLALSAAHLSVGTLDVTGARLSGSGGRASARVRAGADLPGRAGLSADLDLRFPGSGRWVLQDAAVFQKNALLGRASGGGIRGRPGIPEDVSLTVRAESLDLGLLAGAGALKGWSGRLRGTADLRDSGGAWRGTVRVSSRSLAHDGWSYPLSADLDFGPGAVGVTLGALRGSEVAGRLSAPGWHGPWSVRLDLKRARLAAYADLGLGIPRDVSGWASGSLETDAGGRGRMRARLRFVDPVPRLLPGVAGEVDVRKDGPLWNLNSLRLAQGAGTAQGAGEWDLEGARAWNGSLRWKDLDLAGRRTSGEARLFGGASVPGRLSAMPWSLSGTALPPLDVNFSFTKAGLGSAWGTLGAGATVQAAKKPGFWDLQASFRGFDPGPLAGLVAGWVSRPSPLRLSGQAAAVVAPSGLRSASADLAGAGGLRLKGRCQWVSGTADVRASFGASDLAVLERDLAPWGRGLPPCSGALSGTLAGREGALTFTASVGDFGWNKQKYGPLAMSVVWDGASVRIPSASLGPEAGPSLGVENAVWRGDAKAWSASGGVSLLDWPAGIWTLGASARLKASGGGGRWRWQGDFGPFVAGLRRWPRLALLGSWDDGNFQVRVAGRRPRFAASGSWRKGVFVLAGAHASYGGGSGTVSGRVGADGSLGFDASSKGLPVSDLAEIMGWPQDWTGSSWGTVRVTGSVNAPHTVVSAKLEDASVDGLPFDLGTALVVQDGNWVNLSPGLPIRISRRDGTAFEVGGRLPLDYKPGPGNGMDVWAALRNGGLDLLSGLPAVRHASGPLALKLRFRGDPADPRVDGSFLVTDGILDPAWMLPKLHGVEVLAEIRDSKLTLDDAEARAPADGGILRVEAADPSKPAFVFRDWIPADMNLRIRSGRGGLPLRDTGALTFASGVAHPDLTLTGSWDEPDLGGSVLLERGGADKALIQWPPEFPAAAGGSGGGSWFDRLGYHLVLKAHSDVMVRTGAAEVFVDTGEQGMLVDSVGDEKRLYGHLRLVQGSVDYLLATFQLAQDHTSYLDFHGGDAPELELWGLDDLGNASLNGGAGGSEDVQVLLHAWGPLGEIQMRLVDQDDPSLTQDQLAGLVGVGGDSGDPRSQGGFTRMLGSLPANILSNWARRTGLLDELHVSVPAVDQAVAPTPGIGGASGAVQPLAQTTPVSNTARSLLELSAGRYLGSKIFVGVDTQIIQRPVLQGNSYDPELGGVVQYQLPDNARLSAERNIDDTGVADNRVMLEGTSHFDNYNPERRRWDGTPTDTPTPQASVTPSPTPE